ncbi:MAG TPA: TonB-dependent receptor [Caulobacterales bacterium]|nr:TonB-dependent receptor [Caulobacterales bacterium]
MTKQNEGADGKILLRGLSLAALAAAATWGGAARAQETQQPQQVESDEIVVTGFRASIAAAVDIKRNSTSAVDAIVAEDIAKFPDLNLSESIQRIPGVAITRSGGEGRQVSVRGLGPQFTRVRINGMEALSTGGSTDAEGGTNRGRNFDFNIFASELFNNITVRKTASAEVEEGSLGATIDLRTARPFDYDGFTFAASGTMGYNDLSEKNDERVAALISDHSSTFGWLLSAAYSNRDSLEEGASTVRWQNDGTRVNLIPAAGCVSGNGCATNSRFASVNGLTSGANYDAVNEAFHPRIPRYDHYTGTQERLGITGALQWRPSDQTELTLEVLYGKLDSTRDESFIEAPVFSTTGASAINAVAVTDYAIEGNTLVYGVFNNVDIRSEYRHDELSTEYSQVGLTFRQDFADNVHATFFAGRAESDHKNPIQTTLLWDHANVNGYVYDYRNNHDLPLISYGGAAVTDPSFWTLSQIRLRPQFVDNTYTTLTGDLVFDVSPAFSWRGGVNLKEYEYDSIELRRSNGTTSNLESTIPAIASGTATSNYMQIISLSGNGLDLPGGLTSSWAAPNIATAAALWGLYNTANFPLGPEPALGNSQNIIEDDLGAYIQADWDVTLPFGDFRGNVGVRYVSTNQESTGFAFSSGSPVKQTTRRDYDDTLPSLNLVYAPIDDFLIRFGAAKVITRPNLGQINPGATVSVSGSNHTVTAGNPDLDPFRATAYDLAFEYYFADDALFSVALFYKDVDSFVQTVRTTGTFTGNPLGLPDSVAIAACGATPGCTPTANDWQFSLPQNTPGGPVKGYEISLQYPFSFLPGPLRNTGIIANYTHVESRIKYVDSAGNVTATDELTGLSPESWNATLYYEDNHFSARISGAFRSDYLTTIPGRNLNLSESTAETLNVDFASSYTVNEHLQFTLEGLNLTNEAQDQFISPDDRSSFYHVYGREMMLGVRYKY